MKKITMNLLVFILLFGLFGPVTTATASPSLTVLDATNANLYTDDALSGEISIGFNFDFFGKGYDKVKLSTNGFITFNVSSTAAVFNNHNIPNTSIPDNFIAPFWDDLIPTQKSSGGYLKSIYYTTTGSAPNRQFIVQWSDMYFLGTTIPLGTFQAILFEGTNKIQFQYNYLINSSCDGRAMGTSATIGLENADGTGAVKYSFNQAVLTSGDALLFTPENSSYTIDENPSFLNYLLKDTSAASAPSLDAPANNASGVTGPVNFQWDAVSNVSYSFQLSDTPDFSSFIIYEQGLTDNKRENVTGLSGGTEYYWRVGSTNDLGTHYSNSYKFTTDPSNPAVTNPKVGEVKTVTASVYGSVQEGQSQVLEYGHVWSTAPNPTLSDLKTSFTQPNGDFISELTGLNGNTKYYVNSYATTTDGTTYGAATCFTTKAASSNSLLDQLALSTGTLSPTFASSTLNYTTTVTNSVYSIQVTPTSSDSLATVKVNSQSVSSGQASQDIALNVGTNTISVEVTAENGSKRTYTIVVTREGPPPSTNSSLDQLALSSGTLSPTFSSSTLSYTATVTNSVYSIQVTPHTSDPAATLTVNGQTVFSGAASQDILLDVGTNTITIVVTAEDGTTSTYTIVVTRRSPESSQSATPASRQVKVVTEGQSSFVEVDIVRVVEAGSKVDRVQLEADKVEEIIQKAAALKESTIRIIIDELPNDVADEIVAEILSEALKLLSSSELSIEIEMPGVTIALSSASLQQLSQNGEKLYFRVVPMRDEQKAASNTNLILQDEALLAAAGTGAKAAGVPMTIETNYSDYVTELIFSLKDLTVPSDEEERELFFRSLGMFIQHSDGDKAFVYGESVYNDQGEVSGYRITVEKFSTFTFVTTEIMERHAYISGYPDGQFKPEDKVTRAQIAVMLANNLAAETSVESRFKDVVLEHWAALAITQVSKHGLMIGDPDRSFRPNDEITRAEMAAIAARLKNYKSNSGESMFSDVSGHWADQAISAVGRAGIMGGYADGAFRPSQTLTRAEAVVVINKLFDRGSLVEVAASTWTDVSNSHWAFGDIEAASSHYFSIHHDKGYERVIKQK